MKAYFKLQYKLLARKFNYFDIPLWCKMLLFIFAFVLLSKYLYFKTTFAPYILTLSALSLMTKLSDMKRQDFIKTLYSTSEYRLLRSIENLFLSLPFFAYLLYEGDIWFALAIALIAVFMALINVKTPSHLVIPTPFGKRPFEFAIGFRNTFFIYPLAYFLGTMAIKEQNPGLGAFGLILMGFTCFSYYSKPERDVFVWIYKHSPKTFLMEKIKWSTIQFSLLSAPLLLLLLLFSPGSTLVYLGVFIASCLYLGTIILAKYAAYPNEMSLPQGVLLSISLLFPPFLLVLIPLLYSKSVQNLQPLLHDQD